MSSITICQHHWKIVEANGPISEGVCTKCYKVKEFNNSIPAGTDWLGQSKIKEKYYTKNPKEYPMENL